MKLNSISGIAYQSSDLTKTAAFYEALGFRRGKLQEDRFICYVNWFWVEFRSTQRTITPSEQKLYVKVDSVDSFYTEILELGLTPDSEPYQTSSGREVIIRDPDGHQIAFFEKK